MKTLINMTNNTIWIILAAVLIIFWWVTCREEGFHNSLTSKDDNYKYYWGEQTGMNEVCFQFTTGSNNDKCSAYAKELMEKATHKTGGTTEDYNRGVITGIQKGCFLFADRDKTDQCYAYMKEVEKNLSGHFHGLHIPKEGSSEKCCNC